MLEIILFSIIYGGAEWQLLQQVRTTGPKIFLIFSKYHFYMLMMFTLVALLAELPEFIPAMLLLEDLAYRAAKGEWIKEDDWISEWGGVDVGFFIPFAYLILITLTVIFNVV